MNSRTSRRTFLANAGVLSTAGVIGSSLRMPLSAAPYFEVKTAADYTVRIRASAVDIGNKHIVSAVTYNDQFPGPLLRFKEGQPVTVEIHNDTDTPEQLHWHGQFVSPDVDGAAEEGTPFIPAHGMRRITFTPRPAGFRFYHTHNRAGSDLARRAIQRSGRTGVHRTKTRPGRLRPRSVSRPERIRAVLQPGRRHGAGFSESRDESEGTRNCRRILDEGFARQGNAARLRSWLSLLHHQRPHVGARRACSSKARRARALSRPERQCDGDSQPGVARTQLQGRRARRQSGADLLRKCPCSGWVRPSAFRPSCEMNHPGVWIMGDLGR